MRWYLWVPVTGAIFAGALLPVSSTVTSSRGARSVQPTMDLDAFSAEKPSNPLRLLFIHHSCGGQLLAPIGPEEGQGSILRSHPNGGGLRPLLEAQGYEIHEASYGSQLGEHTNIFDWFPKFRDRMPQVLACSHQDESYPAGRVNHIVVFKSCFTESRFVGEGTAPGNASGPALTVWNARAALQALLPELKKHPDTLFVYVTAPPLAPKIGPMPAWKWIAKALLGKPVRSEQLRRSAELAREFNSWVRSPSGWLEGYPLRNVVVFDYYDILTGQSDSNLSAYASGEGDDSHPTSAGNQRAAREFVPFLNRAVHRAGLAADTVSVVEGDDQVSPE
jgi:hypothetical protein